MGSPFKTGGIGEEVVQLTNGRWMIVKERSWVQLWIKYHLKLLGLGSRKLVLCCLWSEVQALGQSHDIHSARTSLNLGSWAGFELPPVRLVFQWTFLSDTDWLKGFFPSPGHSPAFATNFFDIWSVERWPLASDGNWRRCQLDSRCS